MNKTVFLNQLDYCLSALPEQERERTKAWYSEMIDDRIEEGLSEEEAVAALGEPGALARELLENQEDPGRSAPALPLPGQGEACAQGGIDSILLRLKRADAHILTGALSEGETARIDASEPDRFEWRHTGGVLEIIELSPVRRGLFGGRSATLTLTLGGIVPRRLTVESSGGDLKLEHLGAGEARLHTAGGDIEAVDLKCEGALEASTASGDIDLKGCSAADVSAHTLSGDIDLARVDAAGSLDVRTASGDIDIGHARAGRVSVRAASGDVELSDLVCDQAALQSVSGDVTLRGGRADALEAKSISGEVRLEQIEAAVRASAESKSGDINIAGVISPELRMTSVSGDVDARLPFRGDGYDIDATTRTGDLHLPGPDARARFSDPFRVVAHTTSGDIDIRLV